MNLIPFHCLPQHLHASQSNYARNALRHFVVNTSPSPVPSPSPEAAAAPERSFNRKLIHDLRNRVGTILQIGELLQQYGEGPLATKRLHYLDQIQRSATHLFWLIENFGRWDQLKTGVIVFEPAPISLSLLIAKLAEAPRVRTLRGQRLQLPTIPTTTPVCMADTDLLTPALDQLVCNALLFSSQDSPVTVDLSLSEDRMFISIQDHGVGIPADEISQIPREFYRARNVGSVIGSGLGLAVAEGLIRLHGGEIKLSSVEGFGTTATVSIPRKPLPSPTGNRQGTGN